MFYRLFFMIGVFFRNKKIFNHLSQLMHSEFYSDELTDSIQLSKLKFLLEHAKKNSPFYKERLSCFSNFDDFKFEDLQKIPLLTKNDFRENIDSIFALNYSKKDCFISETSGSTGDALIFYRDKDWDAAHRSAIYRGLNSFGVKPWEKSLYLWGFVFTPLQVFKMRILDFLQNRKRLFIYNDKNIFYIWKYLQKCSYVEGYSSVINNIAVLANEKNIKFPNIKLVKCTSEKIYSSYIDNIKRAFNVSPVSEYGAAETGIIAFSCPVGKMHVIKENIYLEVVDGKAVVTNLNSFSMPIIRYDLGDYISMSIQKCTCGRHSQIVDDVLGRVGRNILGDKKEYPSLTLYYVFKYLALEKNILLSYQAVQNEKGKLEVSIFDAPHGAKVIDLDLEILKAFEVYFESDLSVHLSFISDYNRTGKLKDFISNMN
ncbi:hypothetical protein [Shewanella mangrovisoli]|uniref:hypothetical protein n=1 Tax=Shewanella TaxID=22 RepID=UPI00313B668E